MEKQLPENDFLRTHKSFMISVSKITALTPTRVFLGEKEIPIGRNYKQGVLSRLNYK
jgi:DNA-binding LytR/AlgR family response regulator